MAAMAQQGYTIKGNIKGLKDSTLVFLNNSTGATVAQDYTSKGNFSLKGIASDPDMFQLGFIGNKEMAYLQSFNPLKERLGNIVTKINAEPAGHKRDSLIAQFQVTKDKVIDQVNKFIKEKPASPISTFVLYVVNPLFPEPGALETKFNTLQPEAQKGLYARLIEQMIAATHVGGVGTMAADFTQNDTANNPIKLSSFKGKYVLVDFWASWCRPCRMENPNVLAAYNKYKNRNFTVLGVSLDQQKANWIKAINDDKLAWSQVSDLQYWNNAVAQMYHIQSIPSNMLIDPTGKIIAKDLRQENLEQTLQSEATRYTG
ncbi:alkyl hydroperoxide reductase/ thiol specific antioxidant/ Mal allergen [Russula earlei]|uniref:Alkyl hydroperoxide reductase/ thiol specific antioxidant/ Mal allergen n=1 Tax=Russula earlei TaxID=71964 RepID=A0ACC0TVI7_9AGAM|nr:alkyl hydroperoxide reductase/ thiol specific antioxidant/ Mal allergen [Russula earlei]